MLTTSNQRRLEETFVQQLSTLFQSGKYNEVIHFSKELLKNGPKSILALQYQAAAFAKLNYIEEEIATNLSIINLFPLDAGAYGKLGSIYLSRKDFKTAILWLETACTLKQDDFEANYNLALAYVSIGNFDKASNYLSIASELEKHNPDVLFEIANLALKLNGQDLASDLYRQVISISDRHPDAYNNLGAFALESGDPLEAAAYFFKAVLRYPEISKFAEAFQEIACQLDDPDVTQASEKYLASSGLLNEAHSKNTLLPYLAIRDYIAGEFEKARAAVETYISIKKPPFNKVDDKNQFIFRARYMQFLEALLAGQNLMPTSNKKPIFHLGESHCLSFAHRNLHIGEVNYQIQPKICFGLKAFHLGKKQNRFKGIVSHHFHNIPSGSKVFFSAGEIDCRTDEGISKVCIKSGEEIKKIVKDTVDGYVSQLNAWNKVAKHDLYVFNVPAPVLNKNAHHAQTYDHRNVVECFNVELAKQLRKHKLKLIDVYSFTRGHDRFSNKQFHCDDFHLSFNALEEIQKQLST